MDTHPFPTPLRPQSIVDTLVAWREREPNRSALTILREGEAVERRTTYRELHDEVMLIAAGLRERCAPGERVMLLLPTGVEFVTAFFGCLAAGMVAIPASHPMQPRKVAQWKKLQAIVQSSGATLVVAPEMSLELLSDMKARQGLFAGCALETHGGLLAMGQGAGVGRLARPSSADLAFLQYTSGSTGSPKGVMITHGNIVNNQEVISSLMGNGSHTRVVSWLPLYHDMGLSAILQMASVGVDLVLMSPVAFIQKPLRWLQAVATHHSHVTGGPNFAYRLATAALQSPEAADARIDLSSWRLAFCGAEPISRDTVDAFLKAAAAFRFDARAFYPCYGLAEATVQVTGVARDSGIRYLDVSGAPLAQGRVQPAGADERGRKTLVCCGAPSAGNEVRIVGDDGRPVADENQVGEIWVRGPSVGMGYYGSPQATQDSFGVRLHGDEGGPFMRTGDLGAIVGGQLYVSGRLKDLLIIRGRNLYPQDVEDCVQDAVPELRRGFGAAFSVTVDNEEKLVVVQEVGRTQRRSMEPADVFRRMVVAVGEDFGLTPHQIVLVEPATIEKTSSGKIARALCRRAYLANELQSVATWTEGGQAQDVVAAGVPPARTDEGAALTAALRRDIELQIATIAAGFLKTEVGRVSRTTPWSELGFDSVNALQLALKVEHATGIKLDPTMLWECADIQELAARMAGTPGAAVLVAKGQPVVPAGPQPAVIAAPKPRNVDELIALSDSAAEALLLKELER